MKQTVKAQSGNTQAWVRRWTAGLLAAYVALSLYVLWRSAVISAFSDEFNWAFSWYQLQADHRWLEYLLWPHNLNRLVWTRLVIALDMGALGGTNLPLIASGAIALGVMAAILAIQTARAAPEPLKAPCAALVAMLTLMAGNILDASLPINATYAHAAVFAVAALLLSEGAPGSPSGWRGLAAIACAAASAFGSGAGLALWPVMAWGALRRRDWAWLAAVSACGVVFVALYFKGQTHGAGAAVLPALQAPTTAAHFALAYAGLPWSRLSSQLGWIFGAVLGVVGLGAALLNGGRDTPAPSRIASGLILFSLTTAAMAALGRLGVSAPERVPLRYALLMAPLQSGLVMLGAPALLRLMKSDARLAGRVGLAALAAMCVQDAAFGQMAISANDKLRDIVADYAAGAWTPPMAAVIHPSRDFAAQMTARLRRDGLYQHELHLKRAGASR